MYDPSTMQGEIDLGTVNSTQLNKVIKKDKETDYQEFQSLEAAINSFKQGKIDAVIKKETKTINETKIAYLDVYVPKNSFLSSLITSKIKELSISYENQLRQQLHNEDVLDKEVIIYDAPRTNPNYHFTHSILIPLLFLLPAALSGIMMIDFLTEEIEKKTIEILEISPLSIHDILNAKAFVAWVLVPLQATAWMSLLALNGITINNFFVSLIITSSVSLLLVSVSGILSLELKNRNQVQLSYTILIITSLVLSSILPIDLINLLAKLSMNNTAPSTLFLVLFYLFSGAILYLVFINWVAIKEKVK